MPGRMTELMECGPMPVDRLEIGMGRRDLHVVFDRCVERTIAADTEIDAHGLDECFDRGFDQTGRRWGNVFKAVSSRMACWHFLDQHVDPDIVRSRGCSKCTAFRTALAQLPRPEPKV